MRCPECTGKDSKVLETRVNPDGSLIRRRRQCESCAARFTTQEEIVRAELLVVKSDGRKEDLNVQKIRNSIAVACKKLPVPPERLDAAVRAILAELARSYEREVPSKAIGQLVMNELKNVHKVAYLRFASVYLEFDDATEFINEALSLQSHGDKP